ncbi:MAG: zf-HC2 domain-containing protein, partial [Spirochaetes bacterium]|nr:zf-HC2 domain-containing protein [Spirochaetota bacterium]
MKCKKIERLLPEFVNNQLTPEEKNTVNSHLQKCPHCQERVLFYQSYFQSIRQLDSMEAPSTLTSKIYQRLETQKKQDQQSKIVDSLKNLLNPLPYKMPLALGTVSAVIIIALFFSPVFDLFRLAKSPKPDLITMEENIDEDKTENPTGINNLQKEDQPEIVKKVTEEAAQPKINEIHRKDQNLPTTPPANEEWLLAVDDTEDENNFSELTARSQKAGMNHQGQTLADTAESPPLTDEKPMLEFNFTFYSQKRGKKSTAESASSS